MERCILHSDLNSFYASVEMMLDPSLKGKPVAVCGSAEERHGIVLAKSEPAKRAGVKTGMANWQAKQLCPGLIIKTPGYGSYVKYSNAVREIYRRFTDLTEPFGMDESWLDITGSVRSFDEGVKLADHIRTLVKNELGLTVSIGVSFNKVFAKLGSDMKKPDATTAISRENFKELIWPLPASDLLYVGRAVGKKFRGMGINTIGDIARAQPGALQYALGKNGLLLWGFANGLDTSPVMYQDFRPPVKSVGHGITCLRDLTHSGEVWQVMLDLAQDIGKKLREDSLAARGVQITARRSDLSIEQYQCELSAPSQSPLEIAREGMALFEQRYDWATPLRSVTIRAIDLAPDALPLQLDMFSDAGARIKQKKLDDAVYSIRRRFGARSVFPASLVSNAPLIPGRDIHKVKPDASEAGSKAGSA